MEKNTILEELTSRWKTFILSTFGAFIVGHYGGQYMQNVAERWGARDLIIAGERSNNLSSNLALADISYNYLGKQGFTLEAEAGGINYSYRFGGSCRDELHLFGDGIEVSITNMNTLNQINLFDADCNSRVDSIHSENGACSTDADADSRYESCNQRTYDEAQELFENVSMKLRVRDYFNQYYDRHGTDLPEEQTERLLKNFRTKTP